MFDFEVFDFDVVDVSGNIFFYLVVFGKCFRWKCDIVRVFVDVGVNLILKNIDGKVLVDYFIKKDFCVKFIRVVINLYKSGKKFSGGKRKRKVLKILI